MARVVVEMSSRLAADADAVWARAATPEGVNAELMPLVRMTFPHGAALAAVMDGRRRTCWLLAFGVLPFDRHRLGFEAFEAGRFAERSYSLLHREWRHDRKVEPDGTPGGCVLSDRVEAELRLPFPPGVHRWMLTQVFAHRHRRLRKMHGVRPDI